MRVINNSCLEYMKSPIRFIMNYIPDALVNIAPENKNRFETEYPDFILEFVDTKNWQLEVDTRLNKIYISRKVVEIFWAVSYGYMTFYQRIMSGKLITEPTIVDLNEDPKVLKSMQLLNWIYKSWINNDSEKWPTQLPKPLENPSEDSMEKVADELCLCAVAYLLHHELAHIRLLHKGESEIESEKEADFEATEWLLNHNIPEDDMRFIKRAFGIAISFEVLTARGIYTGDYGGKKHPYSYDRLFNSLDRYINNPTHIIWAFLSSVLKLHLDNEKIEIPYDVFDDFKQCVNSNIDLLSKLKKNV